MYLGIDALVSQNYKPLYGARIGLLTNISSCNKTLQPTIALFSKQKKCRLKALFAPEHGLFGALQDQVRARDYYDEKKKVRVFSLYNKKFLSDISILRKIDVLVIDLQDIGTRYYTFLWSALLLIQMVALFKKRILILDRPNPLDGVTIQGPVLEPEFLSFVGLYLIPIRHGMTVAELCILINEEMKIGAKIKVVKMKGWLRRHYFDETGLWWTVPSPNMPSLETALVYPGMCLLEGTNVSEGRGTTRPFEIFGAPWISPTDIVKVLKKKKMPGAGFRPTYFIPTFNKFKGKPCGGAQLYVTNKKLFNSVTTGLEIIRTLRHLYPKKFRWRKPPYEFEKTKMPFDILVGNSWIRKAIEKNKTVSSMKKIWQKDLLWFKKIRKKYLIYK